MDRILEISYKFSLSHIGSSLTCYPILENIYKTKNPDDIVVLSCGHAGLSQYVAIEKYSNNLINAEDLLKYMGIHPMRDVSLGIHVSTGALGSGLLIAIGLAIANRNRYVYVILSDGECAEGYIWEGLAYIQKQKITNLIIHVNINGYSAYDIVDRDYLEKRLKSFYENIIIHHTKNSTYLGGLNAHYHIMKNKDEIEKIKNS
jgi:transketolase